VKGALLRDLRRACLAAGVHYDLGPRRRVAIDVLPDLITVSPEQHRFLHRLSETINRYLRRTPGLWIDDPAVRAALPLPDAEARFVEDCWRPEHDGAQTVVSRNDFDMPDHPEDTVAFEPNGCSIGGIYYAGACAGVIDEVVLRSRGTRLRPLPDPRDIFCDLLQEHARLVGAPARLMVGILEDRDWDAGITEMPSLHEYLAQRGVGSVIGDPRALELRGGRFRLDGTPVHLLYRNMELTDLVEVEQEGRPLAALREAFRRNLVVSGLAGDFDHKSLWEVLTSARTRHVVASRDRAFLARHLLWTRLLRHTVTEGPDGDEVDLVPFVRDHRGRLVLKPNQMCGGQGVTLGPLLPERAWQRAVTRALADGDWVVQRFHRGTRRRFDGAAHYVTYGAISSPDACGVLCRVCREAVVNVSRGGGLVAVGRA